MDPSMFAPTPEQQQRMVAELLRGRASMAQAGEQGSRYSTLAAVAQMANNPGAAKAAEMFDKAQRKQYSPVSLGASGAMLPGSGEFVPSPMHMQDKTEDRALRLTLAQMAGGVKSDKVDVKLGRDRDMAVTKYSTMLEKASVPEFGEALNIVESTLKKHKEGQLPGYGRVEGFVPDKLATDAMQDTRSALQQAANILLKSRSGAAVTESEMRRFLTEVASGAGMDEKTLRAGWARVRQTFDEKVRNLSSSASPEVQDEYVKRGGKDFRKPASGTSAPSGVDSALWEHMTEEEKALWKN